MTELSKKWSRIVFLCTFAVLLIGCAADRSEDDELGIPLESCEIDTVFGDPLKGDCGSIQVPENRAEPNGRQLDIHFVRIPALNNDKVEDPIFFLAGGPGQAAIETFPMLLFAWNDLRLNRDIVLVDQRGTGQSGALTCAEIEPETPPFTEPTPEEVDEFTAECINYLSSQADLTQYTTDIAAQDLDEVRAALGYETINLYGISYGTRAAMVYARLFEDRVRTLLLDAVTSPELIVFLQSPQDGQASLEQMFARCNSEVACREAFPTLEQDWDAILTDLESPQMVTLKHPRTLELLEVELSADVMAQNIFNLLYSPEVVSILPLMISEAADSQDYSPLLAQGIVRQDQQLLYEGMFYSIICAEDARLIDMDEARSLQSATDFPLVAEDLLRVCEQWPLAEPVEEVRQNIAADIPTLLMSGAADPITPPLYADQIASGLNDMQHIVLDGYGHGVGSIGCMPDVMGEFLNAGTAAGLDTSCVRTISPVPFFTSFTGPEP